MSTHASNTASPGSPEARFGVADLMRVISERRSLIRNVALMVVGLTAVVMFAMPTLYSTSAVVMLDQRKNNVADLSSVLSALPTDPSSVQNQIQVLSSRDLALQVINKLKLDADPEFNPAAGGSFLPSFNPLHYLRPEGPTSDSPSDAIVNAFLSRLDVNLLGMSTSIEVTFTARDPNKAAQIANALAQTYTDDQVATKVRATRQAAHWLSGRMRQLALQVQQQENAVQLYKTEHDLVESADGKSLVDQQLVAINAQLVSAQSDLAEKRAAYERVAALARTGNAADVTPVVNSKMIGDLRAQEGELVRQEADLATRYGPNHPKMVAIRNEKKDLAGKIAREVAGIAGSMESDLEVARAHVDSIEASLKRVEREASEENLARVNLNALEANLASTKSTYESFVARLRAVQDQDGIQIPEARVISTAPVPASPSSPHRTLFIAASIPAGLLLGILAALLAERFQMPPRLERAEPVPAAPAFAARPAPVAPAVLAELAASIDLRTADWVVDNLASPYGRSLTSVLHSFAPVRGGPARVVALASAQPDHNTAVVALGLARVAARYGLRVVLVDADFGRIVPQTPDHGIAALLNGIALPHVLQRDRRSTALLLSSMPSVWTAPRTADLFRHLRLNCDLVLVDAAPPGAGGCWPALARLCDEVVIVTAAGAPHGAFDAALRSLVAMSVPLLGLIVTR
jgi:polysaccharide biosynthesis transport protein